MTTLKDIARNPRKALRDLEKNLGAQPGDLLRDMESLAAPGEEWSKHLPYRVAASYYDDEGARASYEAHVDQCEYCKTLLESLHPTSIDVADFSKRAVRLHAIARRGGAERVAPYALAASIVIATLGAAALLRSKPPALTADAKACVAGGGTATGCTLLQKAADFEVKGEPQLARGLVVAGLAASGVKEPSLKRVTAAIDPALPTDAIAPEGSSQENSQSLSRESTGALAAARSNFAAGKPVAGYEQILTYLKESQNSNAPAVAFETAFVKPVRVSSSSPSSPVQPVIQARVGEVNIGIGVDSKSATAGGKVEIIPAGEPIHLVTEVYGVPGRTPVSVIWVGPNNQEVRKETNWTREGQKSVAFTAPDTTAWKSGDYRAELWVADKKITQEPFEITQATDKAQ